MSEDMAPLKVSEIFGPTIQGEGPATGQQAIFLRLIGCNLDCSWCDTPYTWDWNGKNGTAYDYNNEVNPWPTDSVLARLPDLENKRLVITGGEPLLQKEPLNRLVAALRETSFGDGPIDVETNGTCTPLDDPDIMYVISPKIGSSGVTWRVRWTNLLNNPAHFLGKAFTGNAHLKFVVQNETDAEEALKVCPPGWPKNAIWFMPEGRTNEELNNHNQLAAELAIKYGVNFSDRLHIRIWGDVRGV